MPKTAKTAKKISKAGFVRSLPANTPAKEVVAKGKAAGIALSEAYVYNVRSTSKASKSGGRKSRVVTAGRGPGRPPKAAATHTVHGRGAEELLIAVAAELGLVRAIGILQTEHERVHRLLGG